MFIVNISQNKENKKNVKNKDSKFNIKKNMKTNTEKNLLYLWK